MADVDPTDMLLGKKVAVVDRYAPELLYPIPRAPGRAGLGINADQLFAGCDVWHAYELSWLDSNRLPVARVGRLSVPANSPFMLESKSLKLYLNSLNNCSYSTENEFVNAVLADVNRVIESQATLELFAVDDPWLAGAALQGDCIDDCAPIDVAGAPAATSLDFNSTVHVDEALYSHVMRSLCPVTGQPDWATLRIHYVGRQIQRSSLLGYLLAYRNHQEFHEQCVERIFCDIHTFCEPQFLEVQGFYTRRGGLDINPYRSTNPHGQPLPRLNRQ